MTAKMIETLGEDLLVGYDIGCGFEGTVSRTSLGPAVKAKNLKFCVNAFHRYTHCYPCQLRYYPNVISGMGLEDLETFERMFSASNQLVSTIRYASPYHRRLFIEA